MSTSAPPGTPNLEGKVLSGKFRVIRLIGAGGIGGLYGGLLARAGHSVTLFEKADRIGGVATLLMGSALQGVAPAQRPGAIALLVIGITIFLVINMFGQIRLNEWNGSFFDALAGRKYRIGGGKAHRA